MKIGNKKELQSIAEEKSGNVDYKDFFKMYNYCTSEPYCFMSIDARPNATRRQGMLTQGPAPDPKCMLIISSFLTLPHLLDCLNFTRNAMSIVLSLQILGGWNRWGWLIYIRVWVGGQGVGTIL